MLSRSDQHTQPLSSSDETAERLYEKGRQCVLARHYLQAGAYFEQCLRAEPGHVAALTGLALVLLTTSRISSALTAYRKALQLSPGNPAILNGIGNCYRAQGDVLKAVAFYERALEADPEGAEAMYNLTLVHRCRLDAPLATELQRLYDEGACTGQSRALVCFALARLHEHHGQPAEAFRFYAEANAAQFPLVGYDEPRYAALFEEIQATFTPELLKRAKTVERLDTTPIFVLGMPRAGTSLVEQILASHSRVYGAGETSIMAWIAESYIPRVIGAPFPGAVAAMDASTLACLADYHRKRLDAFSRLRYPHVVCKTPTNFFLIGLIRLMFPSAPIVHCVRDPTDTCWSLFRQYFGTAHGYCYDQAALGRYYRRYQRLMAHWHEVLPGAIHDLRYEELVEQPERAIRALLEYCRLPWEDGCLAFYRTKRVVNTASALQVRRPIYRTSIRSWLPVADELAPLRSVLDGG